MTSTASPSARPAFGSSLTYAFDCSSFTRSSQRQLIKTKPQPLQPSPIPTAPKASRGLLSRPRRAVSPYTHVCSVAPRAEPKPITEIWRNAEKHSVVWKKIKYSNCLCWGTTYSCLPGRGSFAVNLSGNAKGHLPGCAFSTPFCLPTLSGAFRHLHIMKLSPCKATKQVNRNNFPVVLKTTAPSPRRPLPDLLKLPARAASLRRGTTCRAWGCLAAWNNFILTMKTQRISSPSFEGR